MLRIVNRPERVDPKHKPTREGTRTDQEKTTTPYKKMNGRLHTHTHTYIQTHTHTDEMFGQRQISHGHLFLFKYRLVGWYFFFSSYLKKKKKAQKCICERIKAEMKQ